MSVPHSEQHLQRLLDLIYDAAALPSEWPRVLESLAATFDSGFADIFSRSHDRSAFSGLAAGLDRADYNEQFLGLWFKRNVWGKAKPVRVAGEVLSTRSMVDVPTLLRSEIYNEYLKPRGLHEGLRLALYAGENGIQDISILRPWSVGAFADAELALGRRLLPHLQRAAAVTRRLQEAQMSLDGGLGAGRIASIAFDATGAPIAFNAATEQVVSNGLLRLSARRIDAATADATRELGVAMARAAGRAGPLRDSSVVRIPGPGGRWAHAMVMPLSPKAAWALPRPPAGIVLLRDQASRTPSRDRLRALFSLTRAEAELALCLAAGEDLREIAEASGRSLHTIRNHLARVMAKTRTNRQSELLRLLSDVATFAEGPVITMTPAPARVGTAGAAFGRSLRGFPTAATEPQRNARSTNRA